MEEPEAIEGYLYQLKPKSQARTSVYLSSHGGNIFVTKPAHAFPPPIPQARVSSNDAEFSSIPPFAYSLEDEKRRVSSQILNSIGCVDLRDVVVVRRASHTETNPASSTGTSPGAHDRMDDNAPSQDMGAEDSDMEEPGGETYLQSHKNSYRLRQKRTLEVTLQAGVTVRFEVRSVSEPVCHNIFD